MASMHYGSEQPDIETSNRLLSYELGRESMIADCAGEASSAEQANE